MLTKPLIGLLFVVTFAASTYIGSAPNAAFLERKPANISHNLIVGSRVNGDYLLRQQIVQKSSSWLQIVTTEVAFDTAYQTISLVRALDQKNNGKGAFASITRGGPGNRNVTVRFKSQRGHGISFILEIYGR